MYCTFLLCYHQIMLTLLYSVLDKGAIHATDAKWTLLAEKVMERRAEYCNPHKGTVIVGKVNFIKRSNNIT